MVLSMCGVVSRRLPGVDETMPVTYLHSPAHSTSPTITKFHPKAQIIVQVNGVTATRNGTTYLFINAKLNSTLQCVN